MRGSELVGFPVRELLGLGNPEPQQDGAQLFKAEIPDAQGLGLVL